MRLADRISYWFDNGTPTLEGQKAFESVVTAPPQDGQTYGYQDGVWVVIGGAAMEPEEFVSQFLDTNGDGTGTTNANGTYTPGSPGKFRLASTTTTGYDITRIIVTIEDTTGMSAQDYGRIIGGLTNGVLIRVEDGAGGVVKNLTPTSVVSNATWGSYCYDVSIKAWGAGNEVCLVRWTLERSGGPLMLRGGEELVVVCQDTLTGLIDHRFLVQGSVA